MELADYLRILRKYWISVIVVTVAGVLVAGIVSAVMTPTYTASSSVFVTVQSGGTAGELQQGSTYAENQVKSFAQVVTLPVVLDPVINRLGLDTTVEKLALNVTATVPTGTAIIVIEVVGTDPQQTAKITNAIAYQLVQVVGDLSPAGSGSSTKPVVASVVAPASVPEKWTSPRVALNLALGALIGLMAGVGQAVVRSRLDTRIVDEDDIAQVTEHSVIGGIAYDSDAAEHPLVMAVDPQSTRAEAYRRLRTNLQFVSLEGQSRVIVVTSSLAGEGKTTTAINTATTLADAGESVLLIEADLRRPKVAKYLHLESSAGLSTAIIGRAELADLVQPVGAGNLHVLTSGELPPNPAELLGSGAMHRLLAEASHHYQTIILDAPPLLPVTDAAILTKQAAGALIVVGSGDVRMEHLASAIGSVDQAGGSVLGIVLNKVRVEKRNYGRYDYYASTYGPEDAETKPKRGRK